MNAPKKILLVDDDRSFVESNKDLLEAYGYEVLTAHDGASGLEIARKEQPDLLVLDVMMTYDTEGFDTAHKIREIPELAAMKIFLVSGVVKTKEFQKKMETERNWLPVDHIMEKPFNPARFIAEIEKLLET
jgi:DNA-binding response OmpR family regulator